MVAMFPPRTPLHPYTKRDKGLVMSEYVTVVFPQHQALLCSKKEKHLFCLIREGGACLPQRLWSTQQTSQSILRCFGGHHGPHQQELLACKAKPRKCPACEERLFEENKGWVFSDYFVSDVFLRCCPLSSEVALFQFMFWQQQQCYYFSVFNSWYCKSTSRFWVTWNSNTVIVYLCYVFISEQQLMIVLLNVYKTSYSGSLPCHHLKKKRVYTKTFCLAHQLDIYPNQNFQISLMRQSSNEL